MENEQHRYALRSGSRSRSQTPSVQARVTMETDPSEHHYDLRSRSRERSRTPGDLMALRKPSNRPSPSNLAKLAEQNIQVISETKEESVITKNESESDKPQDGTPLSRKTERYSTRQKSRKQMVANGQSDSQAREKAEIKRKSTSACRVITSDYSSEEGEREDPPSRPNSARDIYKQAGDWWNVFPKTDYTYSRASQCRYEIAPGILAMPNMSRRSLHSEGDSAIASEVSASNQQNITRGSDDIDSNLLKEASLRERCTEQLRYDRELSYNERGPPERETHRRSDAAMCFQLRRLDAATYLDSDAELEDTVSPPSELAPRRTWRIGWLFTNLVAITVTSFRRLFGFLQVERRSGKSRASYQYEKYHESIWSRLWGKVDGCAQYLYFFVVQIFLFDSWLLSRICSSRHQLQERGSKFTWILLLTPLLLLLGAHGVQMQSFVRLDSLLDFTYQRIETLNRHVTEIVAIVYRAYDAFHQLTMSAKIFLYETLNAVNASLPKMQNLGFNWYQQ